MENFKEVKYMRKADTTIAYVEPFSPAARAGIVEEIPFLQLTAMISMIYWNTVI